VAAEDIDAARGRLSCRHLDQTRTV